jgi:hypothetical protein
MVDLYNATHAACPATIDGSRAVLPVQGTQDDDLSAALHAVKNRRAG